MPSLDNHLAEELVRVVKSLRTLDLKKRPSVSETLDWARTLLLLGKKDIDPEVLRDTLHVLLKYQVDIEKAAKELGAAAPAN